MGAPRRDLAAAQRGERGIDDLEAVEGTAHVSSQNGAHRLLSGERGISRLAHLGRFGHVALRAYKAASRRCVGTLQVAALDAFACGTHRRERSRFLMRLVALHEGDAKLTGGVALARRQVHGGTGADQRNERVALVAERLPGSSPARRAISASVSSSSRASRCCSLRLHARPSSSSPSPVLAVSSGSVSTNSSVESVARLAATSAASALRPSAPKTNARPLRRATSSASLRCAWPTVWPCPLCNVQA